MVITFKIEEPIATTKRAAQDQAMPLRQTDRGKSDEPEDRRWEQQPATREERYAYRVSG